MNTYKRHRFPPDLISYAVWLYCRFNLSHRDIGDLFAERGTTNSYESIRLRCEGYLLTLVHMDIHLRVGDVDAGFVEPEFHCFGGIP